MNHRSIFTVLTLIGTLLGASVAANAQQQGAPGAPMPGHRGMMARAMDGIALTPAEQSQIGAAMAKFKASRKTSTPETHRDLRADVEAALTPAQRTQFEGNIRSLRAQMKAERNAAPPNAQPS